jgi:hypothetical protein
VYGVVIDDGTGVDETATQKLRAQSAAAAVTI